MTSTTSHSEPAAILNEMATIQREVGAIGKEGKNKHQNFNFRGIDQVYNRMHTLFADHGVITMPEVLQESREERTNKNGTVLIWTKVLIAYTFISSTDGSTLRCVVQGEAMDSGDKGSNKAMSIAHKYALFQVFMIPTEDSDPDFESPQVSLSGPQMGVQDLINGGTIKPGMVEHRFGRGVSQLTDEEAKGIIANVAATVANDVKPEPPRRPDEDEAGDRE